MDKKRLQELAGVQLNEAVNNSPEGKILKVFMGSEFEEWYEDSLAPFIRGDETESVTISKEEILKDIKEMFGV